jgi:multidrug efflux pump subunit AcrA (membrane-fusion protein)
MPKIKLPKFIKKIFQMSRKKKIIIITILIIIAIAGYFMFGRSKSPDSIQTDFATKQNLQETVLSTGQVVSGTDLSLSFQGSGVVRQVYVKEGDKVELGQKLAELDQASAMASLTSAKGSLAQAQANYDKLVNGLSQSEMQVYQNAVASADVNLNNVYNSALATLNTGYATIYNSYYLALLIQEYQSFTDLINSKDKCITGINWHPVQKGVLAVSCTPACGFEERVQMGSLRCYL